MTSPETEMILKQQNARQCRAFQLVGKGIVPRFLMMNAASVMNPSETLSERVRHRKRLTQTGFLTGISC